MMARKILAAALAVAAVAFVIVIGLTLAPYGGQ